ncbi:MAG: T9SS type A sorting domain-containing protein [Chlorobium sp.]|nr:T9SS type A sorting domain-containing protein [Chlorobium sp.]
MNSEIMKYVYLKLFFLLLLSTFISAQDINKNFSINVGENFRLYPSNVSQTEVFIANHPLNPNVIFASANTIIFNPFFVSEGIYVTTNGGFNWYGSDTCKGEPITLHGGDPGITIDKDGTFILTRRGFSPGLYSHYSTNFGITWSNQKTISNDDLERATMTSDAHYASPYFGRSYAAWVKFAPPFPLQFSYTDDGGSNWSTPAQINNPIQRSAGGDITMGPDGKVYVCWAGVTSISPFTEDFVGVASSSNGGSNWQVNENAFDMNGISGILSSKGNIRVNGLPNIAVDTTGGPRNNWIYIITTQKDLVPAGSDPDVILNRSSDGGQTWSTGIRVNQDDLNNGAIQYFPAVHVDKYGGLNVIFYDDRNTTSDSTGVFLVRSEDGGNSWHEFEISDRNFKPLPIGGLGQGYQGDNICITSSNDKLWPAWMDNRTGIYQIWTVPIEISSVNVEPAGKIPYKFSLKQNYPNPFNPSTKIGYSIPQTSQIQIKVYDILGKEIETLVNEEKPAGNYEVTWDAANLPSGVYFYQLRVGGLETSSGQGFIETKKMLLLK